MLWIGTLPQTTPKIGHLLNDVRHRQSGKTGILWTPLAVGQVTVSAGEYFRPSSARHNLRHRRMTVRTPVRNAEHICNLLQCECARASRNTLWRFILGIRPFIPGFLRRIDRISPIRRSLTPQLPLSFRIGAPANSHYQAGGQKQGRRSHRRSVATVPLCLRAQTDTPPPDCYPAAQNLPQKPSVHSRPAGADTQHD